MDGKCPHVTDKVQKEWLTETSVYAAHIAVAVGTEQAENAVAAQADAAVNGIFKPDLYAIAVIKKKFHRVQFHYHYFSKHNDFFVGMERLSKPVKLPNSNYAINSVGYLEAIVQINNKKLLKDYLEIKAACESPYEHPEIFHYVLKHGLIEVQDMFLDYLKAVTNKFENLDTCIHKSIQFAIMYNNPYVLDKLLQPAHLEPSYLDSLSRQECYTLCDVFNSSDCKEVLCKYGIDFGEDLESKELLRELIKFQTYHDAEFKDEISRAFQKISNIQEAFKKYLNSYPDSPYINSRLMESLVDLNVFTDKNGTFKDKYSKGVFKEFVLTSLEIHAGVTDINFRETAKTLAKNNLDLDIPESALEGFLHFKALFSFRDPIYIKCIIQLKEWRKHSELICRSMGVLDTKEQISL